MSRVHPRWNPGFRFASSGLHSLCLGNIDSEDVFHIEFSRYQPCECGRPTLSGQRDCPISRKKNWKRSPLHLRCKLKRFRVGTARGLFPRAGPNTPAARSQYKGGWSEAQATKYYFVRFYYFVGFRRLRGCTQPTQTLGELSLPRRRESMRHIMHPMNRRL
jgi:hypothetical protein